MQNILDVHEKNRKLTTLVENQTTYNSDFSELNIFETHEVSERVSLKFDFPIIASMLTGKKIMHFEDITPFSFLPGETVVVPEKKEMVIDFPIATNEAPTRCLALGIDPSKINEVALNFNRAVAIENENNNWSLDANWSHLTNNESVNHLIDRLVVTFVNNTKSKDALLDLMIQELIIRLLQTKARYSILHDTTGLLSDSRIGFAIKYIKENLTNKDFNVDMLAGKAYMSTSHFYKKFKNTLGVSPIDYINSEKIKFAKKLIKENTGLRISEIAFMCGFNNTSYFNRQFKKMEMITPQQFKASIN